MASADIEKTAAKVAKIFCESKGDTVNVPQKKAALLKKAAKDDVELRYFVRNQVPKSEWRPLGSFLSAFGWRFPDCAMR